MLDSDAVLFPKAMSPNLRQFVAHAIAAELKAGSLYGGDAQISDAIAGYKLPITQYLLGFYRPIIELFCGLSLATTFSYLRIYPKGRDVPRHIDREEAELTVSLLVASSSPTIGWPFVAAGRQIIQQLGDAILIEGSKTPHSRPPVEVDWMATVILCYVRNVESRSHLFNDRSMSDRL